MQVVSVAAVGRNLAIGLKGHLPWEGQLPQEFAFYHSVIRGGVGLMGRVCWQEVSQDMEHRCPLRFTIVVSRSLPVAATTTGIPTTFATPAPHCIVQSVAEGLTYARTVLRTPVLFILGGTSVYREVMEKHWLTKMCLSEIPRDFEADTFYPAFDRDAFTEVSRRPMEGFTVVERVSKFPSSENYLPQFNAMTATADTLTQSKPKKK